MVTKKQKFQSAFTNAPQFVALFTEELDGKITSLKELAQRAEDQFWAMAAADFAATGAVTQHTARDAADVLCAGAVTIMNDILGDLATVLDTTPSADLDWTSSPTVPADAAKKSLYAVSVADVCDKLLVEVGKLRDQLEACYQLSEATNITGAYENLYAQTYAAFSNFGPNFPTPLTAFYSCNGATTYLFPKIGAELDTGNLLLYNHVKPSDDADFQGYASGFHQIIAGDTILIAKLEVEGFEDFVGLK